VIGLAVWIASLPIAKYRKDRERGKRVAWPNPFYATRVLIMAKATSIASSAFLGWHAGQLLWLLSFGFAPTPVLTTSLIAIASLLAVIGGLLAEWNCRASSNSDGEAET
jgi:hypothetical protein